MNENREKYEIMISKKQQIRLPANASVSVVFLLQDVVSIISSPYWE